MLQMPTRSLCTWLLPSHTPQFTQSYPQLPGELDTSDYYASFKEESMRRKFFFFMSLVCFNTEKNLRDFLKEPQVGKPRLGEAK